MLLPILITLSAEEEVGLLQIIETLEGPEVVSWEGGWQRNQAGARNLCGGRAIARWVESTLVVAPTDIATCVYYTGVDPMTKQEVHIARHLKDRNLQRGRVQFFKPENYFEVRKALEQAGRQALVGAGCDARIPAQPPREALRGRMQRADRAVRGDYVYTIPNPSIRKGYRPGRRSAGRRPRPPR